LRPSEQILIALGRVAGSGKLPFQSSIVAAGDSITANGWTNSSTQALIDNRSWWNWANNLGGNPFKLLANSGAGVGGNSSGQLLTRYTTDVTSKNPKVVTILIGTNDLASVDPNTTISNIAAMLSANAGIGAKTVLLKILPRGGHSIAVMTPTQITAW
jgi:lysophospholipase L1-like esterase